MRCLLFGVLSLSIGLILGPSVSQAQSTPEYLVKKLPDINGSYLLPAAMNSQGDVVGYYTSSGRSVAFIYRNGLSSSMGGFGGWEAYANGISDAGHVVGARNDFATGTQAFLYFNRTTTILPTLGGQNAGAVDVNSKGEVVGGSQLADGISNHAFIYRNGQISDLGTLSGHSTATAINELGVAAGQSLASDGKFHAVRYENNQVIDLGTPGGDVTTTDINSHSQVVGRYIVPNSYGLYHAFLHNGTTMKDLGTLGGLYSEASAINDDGWVVGTAAVSGPSTYGTHAFLYRNGIMEDLNSLVDPSLHLELYAAADINNSGQIVALGTGFQTYLLTPASAVPEPSTIVMLLSAIPAIAIWRARRKR